MCNRINTISTLIFCAFDRFIYHSCFHFKQNRQFFKIIDYSTHNLRFTSERVQRNSLLRYEYAVSCLRPCFAMRWLLICLILFCLKYCINTRTHTYIYMYIYIQFIYIYTIYIFIYIYIQFNRFLVPLFVKFSNRNPVIQI